MVEAKQEWFHRATLAPVKVAEVRPGTENIKAAVRADCRAGCAQWFSEDVETFERDYSRDAPLTLGLLGRLGWEVDDESKSAVIAIPAAGYSELRCFPKDGSIQVDIPTGVLPLVGVSTLRELLMVTRTFEVPDPQEIGVH